MHEIEFLYPIRLFQYLWQQSAIPCGKTDLPGVPNARPWLPYSRAFLKVRTPMDTFLEKNRRRLEFTFL